jgi:hypothetical protein
MKHLFLNTPRRLADVFVLMFLCILSTFGQVNQMERMVAQKLKDANPILLPQQAGALMTQARPADRLACATAILRYVVQHRPTSALVVLQRRMRSLGRAADTPYMVISLISRSLAEINTAAELITATINQSISDPHAKVSFADVAAAILKDQISIGSDGQISSINVTAIGSPKLQTALAIPTLVDQVRNEVNTAAQDPESPYGSALVQATTSPMESVAAGEAVEVGEDYARKYSRP